MGAVIPIMLTYSNALYHVQLHQLVSQQLQGSALLSLFLLAAQQRDQMRFLFSIQFAQTRGVRPLPTHGRASLRNCRENERTVSVLTLFLTLRGYNESNWDNVFHLITRKKIPPPAMFLV